MLVSCPLMKRYFTCGLYFEGIAAGHNHVAKFPCFERSQLIADAEYLRGIQHYGFHGFVMRQSIGDGGAGILRQAAREGSPKTGKRERNSRGE